MTAAYMYQTDFQTRNHLRSQNDLKVVVDAEKHQFSKLKNLEILTLGNNQIIRPIPSWLGTLPRLLCLDLLSRLVYEPNIASQVENTSYEFELPIFSGVLTNPSFQWRKLSFFGASIDLSNNNIDASSPVDSSLQQLLRRHSRPNIQTQELREFGYLRESFCGPNKGIDEDDRNNMDNGRHQLPWFYIFTALGFIVEFRGVCGSLIINKTWRSAFFQFIDNVQHKLYVMILVRINMIKRRLRG
ncbi:hypothetical protein PRUPE_4G164200 [Prunus persica]|uniref:Uncharacterized protein n=1 Tax=Prunus persica TaxID=3760 RepID=A0A251PPR0_PRUPE|nr:hypothetical protein PRUPE_4G164200 [Prunus persica]